jgi:hypothetical protein
MEHLREASPLDEAERTVLALAAATSRQRLKPALVPPFGRNLRRLRAVVRRLF